MNNISFELVTPEGIVFEGAVDFLKAAGVEGEFGIYPGHIPFFTLLKDCIIEFRPSGEKDREFYFISGGVFEFFEERMMILSEEAVSGKRIDYREEQKNERDLAAAVEKSGSDKRLELQLKWVRFKMKAAELSGNI